MADTRLVEHRRQWEEKAVLRDIYTDLYRRMVSRLVPGRSLEVGGGSGNLKAYAPEVVATDLPSARPLRRWFSLRGFDTRVLPGEGDGTGSERSK